MEQINRVKWLKSVEINRVVKACIEDVGYLLSVHSAYFGLDSSEIFYSLKDELEVEFRANMEVLHGTD